MEKKYLIFYNGEHFNNFTDRETKREVGQLFGLLKLSEEEVIEKLKNFREENEQFLDDFFGGCDYDQHVEGTYDNRNWLNGILFVDKMGQQAFQIYVLTEEEMMNTIITSFDKLKEPAFFNDIPNGNVWHLGDKLPWTTWMPADNKAFLYRPVNLVERVDEEGERQIDVEMDRKYKDGFVVTYVDNLEEVGYPILFNIYMVSWAT